MPKYWTVVRQSHTLSFPQFFPLLSFLLDNGRNFMWKLSPDLHSKQNKKTESKHVIFFFPISSQLFTKMYASSYTCTVENHGKNYGNVGSDSHNRSKTDQRQLSESSNYQSTRKETGLYTSWIRYQNLPRQIEACFLRCVEMQQTAEQLESDKVKKKCCMENSELKWILINFVITLIYEKLYNAY